MTSPDAGSDRGIKAFRAVSKPWLKRFPHEQPKVPVLSHYTTAEGLRGICTSNALWATCAQYSNDVSEVVYARSVALEVMDEFFGGPGQGSAAAEDLRPLLELAFSEEEDADAYIVSLCESSDLLSQWRAYGKTAGFEIRFESLTKPKPPLRREVLVLDSPFAVRKLLTKVTYNEGEQRATLKAILEGATQVFHEALQNNPALTEELPVAVAAIAFLELTQWLYSVKHPAFAEEQEWRLIAFPKRTELFFGGEYRHYNYLRFRPGRHSLVPYIELTPSDGKLPITEIVCGPGGHHRLTAKAVEFLLASAGHRGVKVRNSDVPLAY